MASLIRPLHTNRFATLNGDAGAFAPEVLPEPVEDTILAQARARQFRHFTRGMPTARVMVLCDPPTPAAWDAQLPMSMEGLKLVARHARAHGFGREDFCFLSLCPPIRDEDVDSASRRWAHAETYAASAWAFIEEQQPDVLISFGDLATRVLVNRAVAITKARGQAVQVRPPGSLSGRSYPLFPMLAPSFISRVVDHEPTFASDWASFRRFEQSGYTVERSDTDMDYEWCEDLAPLVALIEAGEVDYLAVDTETDGVTWHDPRVQVLTVQISYREGHAFVCPIDTEFWPEWNGRPRARAKLISQIRSIMQNRAVKKAGTNLKFDVHMLRKLGIELAGWEDDAQLLAFNIDENMMEKSQEEMVRRWAPELAAAKASLGSEDKSNMRAVPRDQFLVYAGSDTDGVLRLVRVLKGLLAEHPEQERIYRRVQMPGIRSFAYSIERFGMLVDQAHLRAFGIEVETFLETEYNSLISQVPAKVRLKHMQAFRDKARGAARERDGSEALKFSRAEFVRDTLFSPEGFNLKPVVFTKSTQRLDADKRIPSTSAKDHLPFFTERSDKAGTFVSGLIGFQKAQTLSGTFIGTQEDDNGLWQYVAPNGRIYPSYFLHRTVTGRTASSDPNGQNFPKRGKWAKPYQRIFKATPGFKLINCDLSQIELRIAAWMAMDRAMLGIYRAGGDIHLATAKAVSGLSDEQWNALSKSEKKEFRTKAKACNFGFLYGMGANKFRNFAKTDYGVTYTDKEAHETRARFFSMYAALPAWHDRMRTFAKENGYVQSLHGAIRHLPSINSNDRGIASGAERQAINSPVQRFGSDLGVMAMNRFVSQVEHRNLTDRFRMIGFVHDALVMEVADGYEQEGLSSLIWTMNNPKLEEWFGIRAPLPLLAEGDIGLNAGEMMEMADLPELEKRPQWFRDLGFDTVTPAKPSWWDDSIDSEAAEPAFQHLTS